MELIKPFDPWGSKLCTCPAKYSLSAYTGCSHGCLYCYASSYIRDFSHPRPKKDFLIRLRREIKKIPAGSHLTLANSSDPYLSLEKKLQLTRKALEVLSGYDVRISLVTKSALIMRDMDVLKRLKNVAACISMTTVDGSIAEKLEPHASLPKQRLAAVKKLSRYIPVAVRLDPLIYPLTTDHIEKIVQAAAAAGCRQVITSTYKTKPDNYKRMLAAYPCYRQVWQRLYREKKGTYIYLPFKLREELMKKVALCASKNGLRFSCCREGLASLNTATCDGS